MPGLDNSIIEQLDPSLALKRINKDVHSDFIYAPHLNFIFSTVGLDLWDRLRSKLSSGSFDPLLPITLEVPKRSGFPRPGAILWPFERLAYQAVVDFLAPSAEAAISRDKVFSYELLKDDPYGFMFEQAGTSYDKFADALKTCAHSGQFSWVLKADVASYFERIYQHLLINALSSSGCDTLAVSFLEKFLSLLTQKDSHGIIQGVAPSDFLGTFYLCPIDALHDLNNLPFLRYTDDIHVFFNSERSATKHKMALGAWLRGQGLNLNEAKTRVLSIDKYLREETSLGQMFEAAKVEAREELERSDFYGTTTYWDEEQPDDPEEYVTLGATRALFELKESVTGDAWYGIEKFCLSIFTASFDPYIIGHVMENFADHPHFAEMYASYLRTFINHDTSILAGAQALLANDDLYDYQLLWLYALLMSAKTLDKATVTRAIQHLKGARSEPVRAAAAVVVGKYGDASQRHIFKTHYQDESSAFVRAAILYSARHLPAGERNSCYTAWGGHSEINSLIVKAAKTTQ